MTDPTRIWRGEDTSVVVRCDWPGCHEVFVASAGYESSSTEMWRLGWTKALVYPDRCRRHPSPVRADGTWTGDIDCVDCRGLGLFIKNGEERVCPCGRDTLRRSTNW